MNYPSPTKLSVPLRTALGVAALCILLGVGNILYGDSKLRQYSQTVSDSAHQLSTHDIATAAAPYANSGNPDAESQYLVRVKARLGFYELVVLGGKCFLALGGVLLLASLVMLTPRQSQE